MTEPKKKAFALTKGRALVDALDSIYNEATKKAEAVMRLVLKAAEPAAISEALTGTYTPHIDIVREEAARRLMGGQPEELGRNAELPEVLVLRAKLVTVERELAEAHAELGRTQAEVVELRRAAAGAVPHYTPENPHAPSIELAATRAYGAVMHVYGDSQRAGQVANAVRTGDAP